ncbi:MAG: DUF2796 domain-containing protein [Alphaproteobacteria bacterium]|nr:DUF2796 domain-containing protein [Alphaproteobacteria bacterium]
MKYGRLRIVAILFGSTLVWSFNSLTTAVAEEGAHQHGVSHLNIAIEGNHLEMELIVPGSDAVGFEHSPSTTEDRKAVQAAAKNFKDGMQLFVFSAAANCRFEHTKLQSSLLDKHSGHKHHAHKKHDHAKHSSRQDKKASKEPHAEFHVHYHIECANPGKLTYIDARFFKSFPSAQKLVTRWVTARGQGAATLTPAKTRLTF